MKDCKHTAEKCKQILKIEKHTTSQTRFGFINMESYMHRFWDTAFHFCNFTNRTLCKSTKRGTCSKVKCFKRKSIGFVFALFAKKSWWGVKWKWFVARAKLVWPVGCLWWMKDWYPVSLKKQKLWQGSNLTWQILQICSNTNRSCNLNAHQCPVLEKRKMNEKILLSGHQELS